MIRSVFSLPILPEATTITDLPLMYDPMSTNTPAAPRHLLSIAFDLRMLSGMAQIKKEAYAKAISYDHLKECKD